MMVKLFEQWMAEEEKVDDLIQIAVDSYEAGQFELTAKDDDKVENQFSKSYQVVSSTNPNIKSGASVMVSPIVDKEGDFELMVVNDPATGTDILNYSGKVNLS